MTSIDSHSASKLHKRLRDATRAAQLEAEAKPAVDVRPATRVRRRLTAAASWKLLQWNHVAPGGVAPSREQQEHAVRHVLAWLLESGGENDVPYSLDDVEGPVLIVRSGPWPVLRSLLDALAKQPQAGPISVLCHKRDADELARLAEATGLELAPIFYPRFEPFVTARLRRILADGVWATAFVLEASKHGRGWSLEHITSALDASAICVWNGSNTAFRLRSLRERLGREKYAAVRGLLRWHARVTDM